MLGFLTPGAERAIARMKDDGDEEGAAKLQKDWDAFLARLKKGEKERAQELWESLRSKLQRRRR
jgi:hypothetical protein